MTLFEAGSRCRNVQMSERPTCMPVERLGLLHFDSVCGVHPCIVTNMHAEGACIGLPRYDRYEIAADEFDLSLDGFKTTMRCHVAWRNHDSCGVKFVTRRARGCAASPLGPGQ